jgi:hypothetical protein
MIAHIGRFVLLTLLLVTPVQGMAAVLGTLACPTEAQHRSASPRDNEMHEHASHSNAQHDEPAQHEHSGDSHGAGGHSNHLCCHNITSAAPSLFVKLPQQNLPVFVSTFLLLDALFIPEQPQRPPRS